MKLLQALLLLPLFVLGACGSSGPSANNTTPDSPPTNTAKYTLYNNWALSSSNSSDRLIIRQLNLRSASSLPFVVSGSYSTPEGTCTSLISFSGSSTSGRIKEQFETNATACLTDSGRTFNASYYVNNNILRISWDGGQRVDYYR